MPRQAALPHFPSPASDRFSTRNRALRPRLVVQVRTLRHQDPLELRGRHLPSDVQGQREAGDVDEREPRCLSSCCSQAASGSQAYPVPRGGPSRSRSLWYGPPSASRIATSNSSSAFLSVSVRPSFMQTIQYARAPPSGTALRRPTRCREPVSGIQLGTDPSCRLCVFHVLVERARVNRPLYVLPTGRASS